jgi:hypothetical protein
MVLIVPRLFKSLAVCQPWLVIAWEQAAAALQAGVVQPEAPGCPRR